MTPPDIAPRIQPDNATRFVDTTAKLSLLMAVLAILWCLCQWLVVVVLGQLDIVGWMQGEGLAVPAVFFWLSRHAGALSLLMLMLSIGLFAVSWGLLKHREWGRTGFVAFLVLIAVANFALIPLVDAVMLGLQTVIPAEVLQSEEGRDLRVQLLVSRWSMLLLTVGSSLVMAALHGWLIIKLYRPQVRSLFR
ncbi:MAG: hypothetical protein ACN6O2_01915 [Stenotrophomonas sp.]